MSFDVKKTTKYGLMDWFCPHYCRGCGRLGELLCKRCKNDIISSNLRFRAECTGILCVGKREGLLGEAIKEYKYAPVRDFCKPLAELLREILVTIGLRNDAVIVPLPTIAGHIRQRGFDHMWLMGKHLAKLGGWRCEQVLERANNAVQVGQDKETREQQARTAYRAVLRLDGRKTYVLIDDVWTTGASMRAATKELQKAGAKKVVKLVIAVSEND